MNPHRTRQLCFALLVLASAIAPVSAAEPATTKPPAGEPQPSLAARIFQEMLPLAWQKRPLIHFNVFTDMTPEGRKRQAPTAEKPAFYVSNDPKFSQTGWLVSAGERPPPVAELETAMRSALAANGYLPVPQPDRRPDVLIVLSFGSSGTDPASTLDDDGGSPPISASELVPIVLRDPSLFKDVIDRAALIGGDRFASSLKAALDQEVRDTKTNQTMAIAQSPMHLPVSPESGSPFQLFLVGQNSKVVAQLAEVAFHTCYFVIASAYDFTGVEQHKKILLWRTKMTVEAQGVAMDEALRPLITATGSYLGRETTEAVIVNKRIDRTGHVEVGTPTVVGQTAPANAPDTPPAAPATKAP